MTENEFNTLSKDLQNLVKIIPLKWGAIQNDGTDSQINMFQIHSFSELEKQIKSLKDETKNYLRRRWFLWKCAQCDEYLFYKNMNVKPNPNSRDQAYDVEFNNDLNLRFDVKGTVIPRKFRDDINSVLKDSSEMVNFFYQKQSKGVRNNIQNRLFIVHHSYRNQSREMYLRCHWDFKSKVYKEFSEKINTNSKFILYNNVKAAIIFILENLDKTIEVKYLT